jgi:hypothetical protein
MPDFTPIIERGSFDKDSHKRFREQKSKKNIELIFIFLFSIYVSRSTFNI